MSTSVADTVFWAYVYGSASFASLTAHRLFTMNGVVTRHFDEITDGWRWGTARSRRFVLLLGFTVFWPYGVYQMIKKGIRG